MKPTNTSTGSANPLRAEYTEKLRQNLPELKQISGYPIAEDEDILALSDPPYYTACPNPFIDELVAQWEQEKQTVWGCDPEEPYSREPFAADVSEGKNHPIYNAHSYHTKVPHKAIMRYILHYTHPGDIVFDGFCGTGMTGVAARLCGDKKAVEELGYYVDDAGTIYRDASADQGDAVFLPAVGKKMDAFSKLGERKAVLNDLSPAATFIAYNYNTPVDVEAFEAEAMRILEEVEKECGWMYQTQHTVNGKLQLDFGGNPVMGIINYTIWSDVFTCPNCATEIIFWEHGIDTVENKVNDIFPCHKCGAELSKDNLERIWISTFDSVLNVMLKQAKQIPVQIHYFVNGKRHVKQPDKSDLSLLEKIDSYRSTSWYPTSRMPVGFNTEQPLKSHGAQNVHHFYTQRNLLVAARLLTSINSSCFDKKLKLVFQSFISSLASRLSRYNLGNRGNGPLAGTLYIPSLVAEGNVFKLYSKKLASIISASYSGEKHASITVGSLDSITAKDSSIDYIFTDPPFGGNIMYSEMNFIWESWLKIATNNVPEAIENDKQNKGLSEYQKLMFLCFSECYRVLKPGRWMTVEFSNTSSAVWTMIQQSLQQAGFVVANVGALDKKQYTFKAVTSTTAVKKDLIISCYKPAPEQEIRISEAATTPQSAWAFTEMQLEKLPVFPDNPDSDITIDERKPRALFDRMVAYHVQHNLKVPMDSADYQREVLTRYANRYGMVFLDHQAALFDKKLAQRKDRQEVQQTIFVEDERSAVEWLRNRLEKFPQTRQEIYTGYTQQLQHLLPHEKLPELDELLEQNFLCYTGNEEVPSQIHKYLSDNWRDYRNKSKNDPELVAKAMNRWYVPNPNKQADIQKQRNKALLREFASYLKDQKAIKRKLKQFRIEAVRAGFEDAFNRDDYNTILELANRLPEAILQEDQILKMYYDTALTFGSEQLTMLKE